MEGKLWYTLSGERGGANRARILVALRDRSRNANQLATSLRLDYSTIRYHLDHLLKHDIVEQLDEGYGVDFTPVDEVLDHWPTVERIIEETHAESD